MLKNLKMIYNTYMTPKEEKRLTFIRKAKYFMTVMVLYVAVYAVLYLILSLIHALVYLSPYVRIAILLVFFVIASAITNRIMRNQSIRNFIDL